MTDADWRKIWDAMESVESLPESERAGVLAAKLPEDALREKALELLAEAGAESAAPAAEPTRRGVSKSRSAP